MVFVHHITYISCKTCLDTKLMEIVSLDKTLCQHYFKFHHYLQWLAAKMVYNGRQHPFGLPGGPSYLWIIAG
jgi:hypothetical protein